MNTMSPADRTCSLHGLLYIDISKLLSRDYAENSAWIWPSVADCCLRTGAASIRAAANIKHNLSIQCW